MIDSPSESRSIGLATLSRYMLPEEITIHCRHEFLFQDAILSKAADVTLFMGELRAQKR